MPWVSSSWSNLKPMKFTESSMTLNSALLNACKCLPEHKHVNTQALFFFFSVEAWGTIIKTLWLKCNYNCSTSAGTVTFTFEVTLNCPRCLRSIQLALCLGSFLPADCLKLKGLGFFCLLWSNSISTTTGIKKCTFWLIQFLQLTGPVSIMEILGRGITMALLVLTASWSVLQLS